MALGHSDDDDDDEKNIRAGLNYWGAVPASVDGVIGKSFLKVWS